MYYTEKSPANNPPLEPPKINNLENEIQIDSNTYIDRIEVKNGELNQVGDIAVLKGDKMTVYFKKK